MMAARGFAAVALVNPKTPENVGGVLRAAHCYGVAHVTLTGIRATRFIRHGTNTPHAERHMPVFESDDPLEPRPFGSEVVVIELIDGAQPLPQFTHPQRALYVFGPEDGTLGRAITERAQHIVQIPTRNCMNLAACVNVVLYDRLAKQERWPSAMRKRA
jgi:tRNA(Leu) C34 or U34 (ribose-2'-O)-methylase TrmL